jgi:uncharacterized surface protein with fasciclin (FAS1) repeats
MKRSLLVVVAGLALTAACGSSSSGASGSESSTSTGGAGCGGYAAQLPTGTWAASSRPMLTTLAAAVSGKLNRQVDLVDTLDSGQFTIFAPVDAAFAKLPAATLKKLQTDPGELTKILTYHVLPVQVPPDRIVGEQKTVEGSTVTVTGTADDLIVDGAKVICGGVHTANATVYVVDGVLTPRS